MALPKGVKSPVDYTKLFLSQELEGETLDEKALSKSQQRFMGMVYAYKKGEMPNASDEVKKAAESMSKKDAEKYASTKHAKLPEKVEENTAIESELLIQDWNKDDIKFTEVEAIDIIKPEPLKPSPSNWREDLDEEMTDKQFMDTKIKMQSGKYKASQEEQDAYVKEVNRRRINTGPGEFKLNYKTDKTVKDHYNWREELDEDWQKVNRKDKTDGLSKKAVKAYRRENPGSKLQTAVTTKPSKLKKGSKSAKRRLSFCRRMKGMKKKLTSAKTRRDPDSRINKALRRWNC